MSFISHERTVITYDDGTEVSHLVVAEDTPDYHSFMRRRRAIPPAIVSIRDQENRVQGEYIYTERGINFLHDVFFQFWFSF